MYIPIPIPIPNWKSRGFPIPIPIPSQCGDSPSKRGRVRAIPTGTGLFAISSQGNPSLTLHYFKRFTKFTTLHFKNMQEHHIITFESHNNHTTIERHLLHTSKTTKHNLKAWERPNLSDGTTLPTKTTFFKHKHQAKALRMIQDQSSTATHLYDHERERVS